MKEWEIFVPYLPRVKSTKRRWDDMPACKSRPPLLTLPLTEVNNRPMEWRRSDYFYPEMIPEPDYTDPEDEDDEGERKPDDDDDDEEQTSESTKATDSSGDESQSSRTTASSESVSGSAGSTGSTGTSHSSGSGSHVSDDGLVLPKKPSNPYLQSTERQKLHKELKFNQKYGKNVVGKKSELQVAMEKYKENKLRKDTAMQQTSLEKLLDQRAKRIQMQENQNTDIEPEWMDRLKEQRETWIDTKEDEFYRVHAKVVTHGGYSRNVDSSSRRNVDSSSSRNVDSSSSRNVDSSSSPSSKSNKEKHPPDNRPSDPSP